MAARALQDFRAPAGRGRQHRLALPSGPITLIDESYNANPASMRAALALLGASAVGGRGRRIAVLGDMLELGPEEERWHREAGRAVPGRVDLLVCVGPRARWLGEAAADAGLPPSAIRRADSAEEATGLLAGILAEGDVVLFKASRGIGLDRAVASLAAAERG